jgi:hypothetical protein
MKRLDDIPGWRSSLRVKICRHDAMMMSAISWYYSPCDGDHKRARQMTPPNEQGVRWSHPLRPQGRLAVEHDLEEPAISELNDSELDNVSSVFIVIGQTKSYVSYRQRIRFDGTEAPACTQAK